MASRIHEYLVALLGSYVPDLPHRPSKLSDADEVVSEKHHLVSLPSSRNSSPSFLPANTHEPQASGTVRLAGICGSCTPMTKTWLEELLKAT